jgi:hypothetical protein
MILRYTIVVLRCPSLTKEAGELRHPLITAAAGAVIGF